MAKKEKLNKDDWRNATGKIEYSMTNDYMFRMVLHESTRTSPLAADQREWFHG